MLNYNVRAFCYLIIMTIQLLKFLVVSESKEYSQTKEII